MKLVRVEQIIRVRANRRVLFLHALELGAERLDHLGEFGDLSFGGLELELYGRVAAVQLTLDHEHLALVLVRLLAHSVQVLLRRVVLLEQQLVLVQQIAVVVRVLSMLKIVGVINLTG